jgi:hypothetical protein
VQVRLGAVRARELAVGVLDGNDGLLRGGGASLGRGRSARSAGQNAATALGADNVGGLVTVRQRLLLHQAGAVGRLDARLGHDAARGHGAQVRRDAAADGSGGDGLRVRSSEGRLRHHGRGRRVALRRRGVVPMLHLVGSATASLVLLLLGMARVLLLMLLLLVLLWVLLMLLSVLRLLLLLLLLLMLLVASHWSTVAGVASRGRVGRVRSRGRTRRVRVAPVHVVHGCGLWLQRRQRGLRLGQRGVVLRELVRRDGRWGRWVRSRGGRVYTIGRVLRRVHATRGLLAKGCRRGKGKKSKDERVGKNAFLGRSAGPE